MKRIAIAALVAAATMIMAGSAIAQQSYAVQANIPFSFTVNNSQLPSGTYTIWCDTGMSNVINLENRDKGVHIVTLPSTVDNAAQKSSVLVFHRYGEQYFLSDIRSTASATDVQLPMSGAEKKARAAAQEAELRTNDNVMVALNAYPAR